MTDDEIRLAYQTAHVVNPAGDCLTEEQLVNAATGQADASERRRVADHVITCTRCAEEYRLLISLRPWAEESAAILSPAATRAAAVAVAPSRRLMYAMAASLLISFGIGSWIGARWWQGRGQTPQTTVARVEMENQLADARRQVEALRRRTEDQQGEIAALRRDREAMDRPEPNVPIVDLESADAFRGDRDEARTIELPSGARLVALVINTTPGLPAGTYRVDMSDKSGRVIWTSPGLRPGADGTFTVAVPRALLPTGAARLRLYRDGQQKVVEDYAVRFAYR